MESWHFSTKVWHCMHRHLQTHFSVLKLVAHNTCSFTGLHPRVFHVTHRYNAKPSEIPSQAAGPSLNLHHSWSRNWCLTMLFCTCPMAPGVYHGDLINQRSSELWCMLFLGRWDELQISQLNYGFSYFALWYYSYLNTAIEFIFFFIH